MYEIIICTVKNNKNNTRLFYKTCRTKTTKNKYHLQALKLFKHLKAETAERLAIDVLKDKKLIWSLEM